jgi:tight adherence protein C
MADFIELIVRPQMLVMVLTAIFAFITVLTLAMPAFDRDRTAQRMRVMATERDKMRTTRMSDLKTREGTRLRQSTKGFMQEWVDTLDLKSKFDSDELRNKLKMAGMRGEKPLVAFMFFRVFAPPVAFLFALFYLFVVVQNFNQPPIVKILIAIGVGFAGFYLPNLFVSNMITKRQQSIKEAFPDALDMLLICVQSGMSIEAALAKVAKEVGSQSLELAEELSLTQAELSYLGERRLAFENLGKRTGLPGVKAVSVALVQAERYGTPIGQALRVMAEENRKTRMMEAEKKAASLPPKLTVPMILFFLPCLMIVILGPAIIQVMKWT